uniref:Chalcone-flavonone isomerase family protein n=1 Tax=Noccaea caerulescens TaxID=107243 RepID=A0A1J3GYM2_NOCCA
MSSSACLSPLPSVTKLQVDSVTFLPSVNSPASSNPLFLGGAGVRGLDIQGKFVIFTVIGVYLDADAVPSLSVKWSGKTSEELTESVHFFREIVTGAFEKFIKVTMKLPLTGQQYSEKVTENCVAIWKSLGIYTDCEAKAVEKFLEVFKDQTFPPGASILFALIPNGSLTIAFSKDDSIPETGKAVIENKLLAEAVLESIIGKNGVSPGTRLSLAERLAQLMKKNKVEEEASDDLSVEVKVAKEN